MGELRSMPSYSVRRAAVAAAKARIASRVVEGIHSEHDF